MTEHPSTLMPVGAKAFWPTRSSGASRVPRGFTIIEIMVSMVILSLVMVLLFTMVSSVGQVWRRTSGKISAFEGARTAFEAITRKLSQATLNTYWDYEYANGNTQPPTAYVRQSELHLISGQANALLSANPKVTTHAIFFQAPLGYSSLEGNTLQTLLNISGFFIERDTDAAERPAFLQTLLPERTRYRLMEIWQPSENFRVYEPDRAALENVPSKRTEWFTAPLSATPTPARTLSENIIALIIWPRRSSTDTRPPITPDFSYNSRAYLGFSASALAGKSANDPVKLSRNQLPPVLDVAMVAIDEESAARLELLPASAKTLLAPGALFTSLGPSSNPADQEAYFQADLDQLTNFLNQNRLNYRLFRSAVPLRQAKWSEQ